MGPHTKFLLQVVDNIALKEYCSHVLPRGRKIISALKIKKTIQGLLLCARLDALLEEKSGKRDLSNSKIQSRCASLKFLRVKLSPHEFNHHHLVLPFSTQADCGLWIFFPQSLVLRFLFSRNISCVTQATNSNKRR